MSRHLYILDFDRTIFDTARFFTDVKTALSQTQQFDLKLFEDTWEAYVDPESGGYDLHRHHRDLLGLDANRLDELVKQALDDRDYTFPDAAAWIAARDPRHEDAVVITVGRPRYQELKFHHSRPVRNLRKVVVRTNKGEIIRRHLNQGAGEYNLDFLDQPYSQITLIDDSAETFTALGSSARITGIRIARKGQKYSDLPTPPGVRQITSFDELYLT